MATAKDQFDSWAAAQGQAPTVQIAGDEVVQQVECPRCHGEGLEPYVAGAEEADCRTCGGSGEVTR